MKIYVIIMVFSILIGIVFIQNLKADDVIHGTYMPNTILTAQWGEKNLFEDNIPSEPGKFGFGLNAEGIEVGPTAFTVASNGDIYIGDALNDRVQRFSGHGEFIKIIPNAWGSFYGGLTVDKEGNLYCPNTYTANPVVYKFDQDGNKINIYPIVKDEDMGTDKPYHWGGQGNILIDDSGRVFIQYEMDYSHYRFQIGTKDVPFSSVQQKATWKEGYFGITANLPNGSRTYSGYLLGMDTDAEYEIEQEMKNGEPNRDISIIKKYQKGKLVGIYTLNWKQIDCPLLTSFSMGGYQVFDKGNLYVFCSDKEGIKIIKWSPVEGK